MLARTMAPYRSRAMFVLLAALLTSCRTADAEECDRKWQSLAADIEHAETAILVERGSDESPKGKDGPVTYRVLEIVKDEHRLSRVGDEIQLEFRTRVQPGGTGLLLGWDSDIWHWYSPLPVSRDGFDYVRNLPKTSLPDEERVPWFVAFLAHGDPEVADDALFELQRAPIRLVADSVDMRLHADLRLLLVQEAIASERRGYVAKLLGLIGDEDDRRVLRDLALGPVTDFRPDAGGLMGGYLAIAGEDGLTRLEQNKLAATGTTFWERYSVLVAVCFCRDHAPDRIARQRLGQTMQMMLNDPEMADLAYLELGRTADWSVIERISPMYKALSADAPLRNAILQSMIRYLRAVREESPDIATAPTPDQRDLAKSLLDMLQDNEPEQFQNAFRFFPLRRQDQDVPQAENAPWT